MNGQDGLLHVLCGKQGSTEICSSEIFGSHSALSFTLCPGMYDVFQRRLDQTWYSDHVSGLSKNGMTVCQEQRPWIIT